ncbi:MAG: hypothetical protein HQL42_05380 [Alphaproteobacteria bacterium]|nr:hypothetical protein [Alphaproteobacteria bacterium]
MVRTSWSFLALFGLGVIAGPAWACGGGPKDLGHGHAIRPLLVTNTATGERWLRWYVDGSLHAGESGFFRLPPFEPGDRWDSAGQGGDAIAGWSVQPFTDGRLTITVQGRTEGDTKIPVRYVPKQGEPQDVPVSVTVKPPEPPPTLTVEGPTFTGSVAEYRTFQIRLKIPLPEGYRWEVAEAQHLPYGGEGKWLPSRPPEPRDGDGLFWASAQGQRTRIVFIQKRDGWQLFPDTVTLELDVMPTPKC